MTKRKTQGFVAVVSSVILTSILVGLVILVGHIGVLGRIDEERLESHDAAFYSAWGCADYARLRLAQGVYSGGDILQIGSSTCEVVSVETYSTTTAVLVSSTAGMSELRFQFTLDNNTLNTLWTGSY